MKKYLAALAIVLIPLAAQPMFEKNIGQHHRDVDYTVRGSNRTVFLSRGEAAIALPDGHAVRLRLKQSKRTRAEGLDRLPSVSHYFVGNNPKRWRTDVPHYGRVRYREVYPGIDVVYYHDASRQFEYDFLVKPGADPGRIDLAFEGADRIKTDSGSTHHHPASPARLPGNRRQAS